jgi:hypothetical protein
MEVVRLGQGVDKTGQFHPMQSHAHLPLSISMQQRLQSAVLKRFASAQQVPLAMPPTAISLSKEFSSA